MSGESGLTSRRPLIALLVLAAVAALLWFYGGSNPRRPATVEKEQSSAPAPVEKERVKLPALSPAGPPVGGDFTVRSADGPVSLHDFRGKVVLIFFGYTSCPKACPTTLANIGAAFKELEKDELDKVQGIFISFDPENDTVEKLKKFTAHFHPKIIGATAEPDVIKEIAKRYGIVYMKTHEKGRKLGYEFTHSVNLYLVGPEGDLRELLPGTITPEDLARAIRTFLPKG